MENRKLGALLIGLGSAIGVASVFAIRILSRNAIALNCAPSAACQQIVTSANIGHLIVGFISSLISLGVYLLIFARGEETVLKRLEEAKDVKLGEEKFSVFLSALDEGEKKVINLIKAEPGISQHMIKLKTGFSKSKISILMKRLEEKNIIKREEAGKTLKTYLTAPI